MKEIAAKRQDLQVQRAHVKKVLFEPLYPLAIDYIFHNNNKHDVNLYKETLRKNDLLVKFKNAIMQHWSKIKEDTAPGNI